MSEPDGFEDLLTYLRDNRGFDFTGYKRASLKRRITKRMQEVGLDDVGEYRDYLEVHPDEFTRLFNTILINVTDFYRDPPAWEYLQSDVIPRLIAFRDSQEPIRVWSAGCASGEEPYTLAMILAEALGPEEFRRRVKIYATDVDEDALAAARHGRYSDEALSAVPDELRKRYFESPDGAANAVRGDIRRAVIFGRHDLLSDAPIPRIDLMVCRNTLMYFNTETQKRILARLHFALREDGMLFLGKVEMLLNHHQLFRPLEFKHRVFVKEPADSLRERLLVLAEDATPVEVAGPDNLVKEAFDQQLAAQVVVDARGFLIAASYQARTTFGVRPKDIGRPFHDLEMSYQPVELRGPIQEAMHEQRTITLPRINWQDDADTAPRTLEVQVTPIPDRSGSPSGALVSFTDATAMQQLQDELDQTSARLGGAFEELQSSNEEMETTNEELQSTNEELETTNEELQSSNEELETINEELQSSNDELQSMNDELRSRTDELDEVNAFLESIMTSVRGGLVVVDADLRVREWNRTAENLWGLRVEEVTGRQLPDLELGFPLAKVLPMVERALTGATDDGNTTVDAIDRVGREITCEVTVSPLLGRSREVDGAILLMR